MAFAKINGFLEYWTPGKITAQKGRKLKPGENPNPGPGINILLNYQWPFGGAKIPPKKFTEGNQRDGPWI